MTPPAEFREARVGAGPHLPWLQVEQLFDPAGAYLPAAHVQQSHVYDSKEHDQPCAAAAL